MKKFYEKWNLKSVDDCVYYMSESAKQFCRDFKSFLKRIFPNATLTGFKPNHYDTHGFLEQNGVCIYISYNLPRYNYVIDFESNNCMEQVLYRVAEHTRDFTGKANHYSNFSELEANLNELIEKEQRKMKEVA